MSIQPLVLTLGSQISLRWLVCSYKTKLDVQYNGSVLQRTPVLFVVHHDSFLHSCFFVSILFSVMHKPMIGLQKASIPINLPPRIKKSIADTWSYFPIKHVQVHNRQVYHIRRKKPPLLFKSPLYNITATPRATKPITPKLHPSLSAPAVSGLGITVAVVPFALLVLDPTKPLAV